MSERRYGYSETIESIVDIKDSTDGLGIELTTSDVVLRLNQLEAENERLMSLLTPYRLYSELNSAMGHAIRDFNKAIEKDRKHYEALIERAREAALHTGGDDKKLDELKTILDEWEGDALELDYKIASGEIPELDNIDAKMKVNLWFALQDALKQLAQPKG